MEEKTKSKTQEETEAFISGIKNFRGTLKEGFDSNPPPPWLVHTLDKIVNSEATVWFMAGLAIEAAGITVQMFMRIDSYPIMDCVVAGLLAVGLYYYQKKKKVVVDV
jgi:hypothetical protein